MTVPSDKLNLTFPNVVIRGGPAMHGISKEELFVAIALHSKFLTFESSICEDSRS